MARVLLSVAILFGFALVGCSGNNQQIAPPKVTATSPIVSKENPGKKSAQE
ncbi:MAG TPA: hypothetical protein PLN21_17825 [Gemmatales bacterium]|nr:hypothetical protein [Gemmatales bacterium]HQR08689.1 hypothetical protein [Gemmatales bacterium]